MAQLKLGARGRVLLPVASPMLLKCFISLKAGRADATGAGSSLVSRWLANNLLPFHRDVSTLLWLANKFPPFDRKVSALQVGSICSGISLQSHNIRYIKHICFSPPVQPFLELFCIDPNPLHFLLHIVHQLQSQNILKENLLWDD
jgi:hypothetical protein